MLKKNIRLRREYLYNLENENKAKKKFEDKQKIKNAIMENRNIPTELYKQSEELKKELALNDENTIVPRTHMDDEYAMSLYREPQVMITTSRNASARLTQFQKEFNLLIPNASRLNRGQYVVKDLIKMCNSKNYTDMIVIHEHRGEPDGLILTHFPLGPTIYFGIKNCVLRHDFKEKLDTVSEAYPHLIFNNFTTNLGDRVVSILKNLFPVPKLDTKKVMTFSNYNDIISFRNHVYEKVDHKTVELQELGPRFELKPYQIQLGTLDQTEATKEWVLRPYMNTSTKRKAL